MDKIEKKKKILIVDDDPIQLAFAEVIMSIEYDTVSAMSGVKSLELLQKGLVPDLILLDILMPGMDGFDVYNKIRNMDPLRETPIIFLTSVSEQAQVQQALEIGAADYIIKPYNKENLLCRIKNAMQATEFSINKKKNI